MAVQRQKGFVNLILLLAVLLVSVYFINVSNNRTLSLWDESTYANNSLEMERNNNYWVYTVNNKIDHHNTKPPVVLWIQAAGYKLFGHNEFAVRLPSYLGLLGIVALFFYYSRYFSASIKTGTVVALFLITTHGYTRIHVLLSGDLDGLLLFATTFIFLHHLKVLSQPVITGRSILTYTILFVVGYLIKSTAILLVVPSLVVSLFFDKKLIQVFRKKQSYIAVLFFVFIIAGYYFLREMYDPGYWKIVWESEFTRLAIDVQPWVKYPESIYFDNLWDRFYKISLITLAITTPIYLLLPKARFKKLFLHSLLMSLVYLAFITLPPVKLEWYDAPVYPLLSFAMAISITEILNVSCSSIKNIYVNDFLFLAVVLTLVFIRFNNVKMDVEESLNAYVEQERSAAALKKLSDKYPAIKRFKVLDNIPAPKFIHFYDALYFYQKTLKINRDVHTGIFNYAALLLPGDTVLTCQQEKSDSLRTMYKTTIIDTCVKCQWMRLSRK